MRDLDVFDLDERALPYLRQRVDNLKDYAPSLSELCRVLEEVLTSPGERVTTLAPRGTPIERLYEFETGGLLPENLDFSRATKLEDGSTMMPIAGLADLQREELAAVLRRDPGLVCLAVDPLPLKSDPAFDLWPTTFLVGEEIYQLFTSETSDEDFELALFASPFWCDLRIVSRLRPFVDTDHNSTVAELRNCASAATELWCSAYDGEGFLRWRKS